MAVQVVVNRGTDDVGHDSVGIDRGEPAGVVELADVGDDPVGLGREGVVGDRGDACPSGGAEHVGYVLPDGLVDCPGAPDVAEVGSGNGELGAEGVTFGRVLGSGRELLEVAVPGFEAPHWVAVSFETIEFGESAFFA